VIQVSLKRQDALPSLAKRHVDLDELTFENSMYLWDR
jgi:hypothetical protein